MNAAASVAIRFPQLRLAGCGGISIRLFFMEKISLVFGMAEREQSGLVCIK